MEDNTCDRPKIERPPSSQFRSVIWDHFGFPVTFTEGVKSVDKTVTVCRHCEDDVAIKYTGSTTNMCTHMKRHHPRVDVSGTRRKSTTATSTATTSTGATGATGQLRIADLFKPSDKMTPTSTRYKAISKGIGIFLACDMRPYAVVDNSGFKHMMSVLEPRYPVPSRTHFSTTVVPELYANAKANVTMGLAGAKAISMTTDGWTSRATESYITVTAHYITDDWTIENPVLQTRQMHESHTGANLAKVLKLAVAEWKLERPFGIIPIVTDNASNIVNGVKEAAIGPHIRCLAHTVNLAAQRGVQVNNMSRVLGRVRRVVSFFHRSTTATSILKEKQQLLQLDIHKLIADVPTRWNSSYDMVERYLEQQAAIFATLSAKDIRKNAKDLVTLSDSDISDLEDILPVLKPLKSVTTVLCSEYMPTVSMILPTKSKIMRSMTCDPSDSPLVKSVKKAISDDIKDRYLEPTLNQFLNESTALDPRFKSLPHLDDTGRLQVFTALTMKSMEVGTQVFIECFIFTKYVFSVF
jgi:hypothetical protein